MWFYSAPYHRRRIGKLTAIAKPALNVAVIIPTFNRRDKLARALKSVVAQTQPADEIIVIDDGSSDDTNQFISSSFPQVHYIYQQNRGVSAARNTGIKACSADWIALLDSDDEWLANKLAQQFSALVKNPDYKIAHSNEIWIRNGKRVNQMDKHRKTGGWIFKNCLPLCAISPSSVIIHRELFGQIGLFDESLPACEDYDLWLRICSQHPVLYSDEALIIKHGGHEDQLSRKYWGMDRFRIQALDKLLTSSPLSDTQRDDASQMLLQKCKVYLNGARKRNKLDEVARYEALVNRYTLNANLPKQ